MEPRLASALLVRALSQRAEAEGGFAAILHKGDSQSGSILLILTERGGKAQVFERILRMDGHYVWQQASGGATQNPEILEKFLARRKKFDPDLWLLELDVPSVERFAADLGTIY